MYLNKKLNDNFVFSENMYRKGARRWRKLYRINGHLFQAKRFSKVNMAKCILRIPKNMKCCAMK